MDRRRFIKYTSQTVGLGAFASACRGVRQTSDTLGAHDNQVLPDDFFAPELYTPRDPHAPLRLSGDRSVLVIGGGLAGLSTALELIERGYKVTLKESGPRLGGRLSTRDEKLKVGEFRVEHGLHMWFHQYYNFADILSRLGTLTSQFMPFEQIYYQFDSYKPEVISSVGPYPLNLINILKESPNLNFLDAAGTFGAVKDIIFYDHATNWQKFDSISFTEWAKNTKVNKRFWDIIMEPAASVTLNDPSKISAAEMLLYMHYYFIGHPKAFRRIVTKNDHGSVVIDPWAERLTNLGAKIEIGKKVKGLRFEGGKVVGEVNDSITYDYVVIASHVPGTQAILRQSEATDQLSQGSLNKLNTVTAKLKVAPPYSVLRVWFDRPLNQRPFSHAVVETPEYRPINLIANFAALEKPYADWARSSGGSVLEYHLYCTPEFVGKSPDLIWNAIKAQALKAHPELSSAKVLDYSLGTYNDFSSFGVGEGIDRPAPHTPKLSGIPNLFFAGDWVSLPYPTALMERAVTTGREAANGILRNDGVREVEVKTAKARGPGLVPKF